MPTEMEPWQNKVALWSREPHTFVLEALFGITEAQWQPWKPGTPRPAKSPIGPEIWQHTVLKEAGQALIEGKRRFSIRSCHGAGKSTLLTWLVLWFLLFRQPCKVPITANTENQLRDVMFSELALWHKRLPQFLQDMLEISSERVVNKSEPEAAFAVARTARPERPEALQGFHSENLLFVIEEASGIDDVIFEAAGGALSSENSWLLMAGNPTRTSGYFFRSHHENRDQFRTFHVSHTDSSRVSPRYAEEMAREYGTDSNVFRVRVLGEFPQAEDDALIALSLVTSAVDREVTPSEHAVVWGLDVARFGDDSTALCKRRGNVIIEPIKEWKKLDLMQICGLVSREYAEARERPAAINIDVIGLGAGVVDRLRELNMPARAVNVGESPAVDPARFMRLRDELWFQTREWFDSRAVTMPKDDALIAELVSPKYKIESSGKIKVESKDDMKKRGVKSPNRADALCLTFSGGPIFAHQRRPRFAVTTYDPFSLPSEREYDPDRRSYAQEEYDPFSYR